MAVSSLLTKGSSRGKEEEGEGMVRDEVVMVVVELVVVVGTEVVLMCV